MELHPLTFRRFLEEAASEAADEPLLIWADQYVTYQEFNAHVDRAADAWHRLGVRRHDRVAFMAGNKPDFLYAWLGLAKLGAALVAINTGFKSNETRYLLEHSLARYAIIDEDYAEVFATAADGLTSLETTFCFSRGTTLPAFADLLQDARPVAPDVEVGPDDVMSFIYTSGTTGKPKAVMQPQRNFVLTGQAYPFWMRMSRGDRIYACLPLFHINSQAYSMMGAIGARRSDRPRSSLQCP